MNAPVFKESPHMARRRRRRKQEEGISVRSAEFLGWALGGLEREIGRTRERLALLTAQAGQLRKRVAGMSGQQQASAAAVPAKPAVPRRRRLTPEGRKRLSEMMKKRWAERRQQS
jgi:hypothetical protein